MEIQRGVSLQPLNTLALPGNADRFCRVANPMELVAALAYARRHRLPVTVLGGGSNVVLAGDVPGLVIHMAITGIEVVADAGDRVRIRVGAGENWHGLVEHCLTQGWYGLENLALIPGSVGAAPVQNIGAYGVELSEVLVALDAVSIATGASQRFDHRACQFGYRDSVFKGAERDRQIITAITLELSRQPRLRLDYPSLQRALANAPAPVTPQLVANAVCAVRRQTLPDPGVLPNAGSFFKNPVVSVATATTLIARWPDLVAYPQPEGLVKLAAGWLIERAGWRGARRNGAGVHCTQALVLVNCDGCDGRELLALAAAIQADILTKFGVALELEPRVLGEPARGAAEREAAAESPRGG